MEKIVICEVKYTTKIDTANKGLKELMDYCELIKLDEGYIDGISKRVEVTGLLLVDSVEVEKRGLMQVVKIEKDANNKWQSEILDKREVEI